MAGIVSGYVLLAAAIVGCLVWFYVIKPKYFGKEKDATEETTVATTGTTSVAITGTNGYDVVPTTETRENESVSKTGDV